MGLENLTGNLNSAIARVLQQFARGDTSLGKSNQQQQIDSLSQDVSGQVRNRQKPTYAQAVRNQTTSNTTLNLPKKPVS